jgi:carbamoyltransferase
MAGVHKLVPVENFTDHDVYTTFITHLNKNFYSKSIAVHDLWEHHHKLHAACAFYNSGFTEAVCIIKDGMGSDYSITDPRFIPGTYGRESGSTFLATYPAIFELVDKSVIVPFKADIIVDKCVRLSDSPSEGHAFQLTSKHFGFHALDGGKVMGMSSYGTNKSTFPPIIIDDKLNASLFEIKEEGVSSN